MFLDAALLAFLCWGAYSGYKKGFLIEIISLLVIVLSVLLSFKFLALGIELVSKTFKTVPVAVPIIAFSLLFVALFLVLFTIGKFVKGLLTQSILKDLDKAVGALLGLFKNAFIAGNIMWLLEVLNKKIHFIDLSKSILVPILIPISKSTFTLFSYFLPFLKDILQNLEKFISN